MRKITCILFLSLLAGTSSYAEGLFIIVYKGTVTFSNQKKAPLSYRFRYEIPANTVIEYATASRFIVFNKTKFFEETNANANKMDYNTMLKNLKGNLVNSFYKFMYEYHRLTVLDEESAGATIAGTDGLNNKKGIAATEDEFSPLDSACIGTATAPLKWNFIKNISGKLIVINSQTRDTIYNKPVTQTGSIDLPVEKAGSYDWFVYSKMEKKKRINRTFFKLAPAEAKEQQTEFTAFKKEIATLGKESQELLIDDYLTLHKMIGN